MENPLFTPHLDESFNLWNNAVCWMNYWVYAAGRYRSTSFLEKVHKAFFNYYQLHAMAHMPDEIVLVRMMTTLDLDFERALHYHDKGYESNNDYGLPPHTTRPIQVYFVFTTEAPFDPANFTTAQCPIWAFTPKCPRRLPFWQGIHWWLTFNKMLLPMPETDSEDDKEPLQTADLLGPVWEEELLSDSRKSPCILVIPRQATPTPTWQPIPTTPPHIPIKESQPHHPSKLIKWKYPQNLK